MSNLRKFIEENFTLEWDVPIQKYFDTSSRLVLIKKSRQGGFSYAAAAKALARALLYGRHQNIISTKREEASNKLSYVKQILSNAKFKFDLKVKHDSESKFSFIHPKHGEVRILSLPANNVRGYVGDVIADEAWHYAPSKFKRIWAQISPMGVRTEVKGVVELVSSPSLSDHPVELIFNRGDRGYKHLQAAIYSFPWWHFKQFCNNVAKATQKNDDGREYAATLSLDERIELFGNDNIRAQRELAMDDEDFCVEFECSSYGAFGDFISDELIDTVTDDDMSFRAFVFTNKTVFDSADIADIKSFLSPYSERYNVGIDVGRKIDTTEMSIVAFSNDGPAQLRVLISNKNIKLDKQEELIIEICKYLYEYRALRHVGIDYTGMGIGIGDRLSTIFGDDIVQNVNFSLHNKDILASGLKQALCNKEILLPNNSRLKSHLRSIHKNLVLGSNPKPNIQYVCSSDEHHGDIFWALALALMTGIDVMPCGIVLNEDKGKSNLNTEDDNYTILEKELLSVL